MNEELVVVKKRFEDRTMMRTAEADHDHIMHDGRVSKTPRRVGRHMGSGHQNDCNLSISIDYINTASSSSSRNSFFLQVIGVSGFISFFKSI